MSRTLSAVGCILAAMVPLSGCASSEPESPSPVGIWGPTEGAHLELAEDGGLTGSDGCNRLMGSWEDTGEAVEFVGVATTMMMCEDVDDWLARLHTGAVDGDALTIFNIDGQEIGVLDRQ